MTPALAPELAEVLQRIAAGIADHNRRERLARQDTPEIRAKIEALRRPLRKMPLMSYARGCPDLLRVLAATVKIPGNYWTQVDTDTIEVACPCTATPQVIGAGPTVCGCGRGYVLLGEDIRVAFSPRSTIPVDQASDEAGA